MNPRSILTSVALAMLALPPLAHAGPSPAQKCQAAADNAAAKLAQCRLAAEAKFATSGNAGALATAQGKCQAKFEAMLSKAISKDGAGSCPTVTQAQFEAYLGQCTDAASAAAAPGGELPSCGDGQIDVAGEQCDGVDLGGATCALLGFSGGTLECDGSCRFLTAACTEERITATGQVTCWKGGSNGPTFMQAAPGPCGGTGQDGELQRGVALAYQDNGDGTITDLSTGLMWEKKSSDGSLHDKYNYYPWAGTCSGDNQNFGGAGTLCQSDADCAAGPGGACQSGDGQVAFPNGMNIWQWIVQLNAMNFAGHNDWRVPNQRELLSLVSYEYTNPSAEPAFNDNCGMNSSGNPGCTVATCNCTAPGKYWSSTTAVSYPLDAWFVEFLNGFVDGGVKLSFGYLRAVRTAS
jgi:hypothetical protein